MRKIKLILLLILYSINSNSQKPSDMIKEVRVENDTVVWESSKNSPLISVYVKGSHDLHRCSSPKNKDISSESNEGKIHEFIYKNITCKLDSLNNIVLNFLSKETMRELLQSSTRRPILLIFRITENGEVLNMDIIIREEVKAALSSSEYYKIQGSLKKNVTFKASASYGATGCITFSLPITKEHIQAKLSNSDTYIHSN